jgi:GxxExxY protein
VRNREAKKEGIMEEERDAISGAVIGAAIEVHRHLGPGFLEKIYHKAMIHELSLRGIAFRSKRPVPVSYKGVSLGDDLELELIVEEQLVVELKTVPTRCTKPNSSRISVSQGCIGV